MFSCFLLKEGAMKILVLLKEVPVVSEIRINRQYFTIDRSGVGKMMNPSDRHAIEAALALADARGGEVTAMTMGPESSEDILREAVSLGVKAAYRLTDKAFAGADTLATASVLKAAIDATGPYDAIFCGSSTIDGVTGQVPAKLGTMLGYGILTNACKIEIGEAGLTIDRKAGTGYEKLTAAFPLVCSVTEDANTPRKPSIRGRTASKKLVVEVMDNEKLQIPAESLKSPSKVMGLFPPPALEKGQMIPGEDPEAAVAELVGILQGHAAF